MPLGDRAQIIAGFRAELERLAAAPDLVRTTGKTARARVDQDFTWSAKAAQVAQVYEWVLGRTEQKPYFAIGAQAEA